MGAELGSGIPAWAPAPARPWIGRALREPAKIAVSSPAALLAGLVAGIYLSVPPRDRLIHDLPGPAPAAMRQLRVPTFRWAMAVVALATLASPALAALAGLGRPVWLLLAALLLLVADAVHTAAHQTPIIDLLKSWEAARGRGIRLAARVFALALAAAVTAA